MFAVVEPTDFRHLHYKEMQTFLQSYADRFPNIASLYSIGTSVEGRALYVMEISDNPGLHEPGTQQDAPSILGFSNINV